MSFFFSLLAALLFQGAPSDVPKNHWAYGAVNELFENGLLKGYPAESKSLTLQKVAFDAKKAKQRSKRWEQEKVLVFYLDVEFRSVKREPSRYEYAVEVHAAYSRLNHLDSEEIRRVFAQELHELADAISMFQYELTKLGTDPKQMIADLEQFRQKQEARFEGLSAR